MLAKLPSQCRNKMPLASVHKFDGSVADCLRRLITWTTTGSRHVLNFPTLHSCFYIRSGLVSVGELLSELEGLGIIATAAQLELPQDETSNVNYAEFLRLHSKR